MKEVIDDMEWGAVSKSVELLMQRSPAHIALSSAGIGGLVITLPVRPAACSPACASAPGSDACMRAGQACRQPTSHSVWSVRCGIWPACSAPRMR